MAQRAFVHYANATRVPQSILLVDHNPAVQQMRIVLVRPAQMGRHGYFLTLTGVFRHTDAVVDWRAEGTINTQHICGLGRQGMRIWDFGWQMSERGWGDVGEPTQIRLLLHVTDPDFLEQSLGTPASRGCVRIPEAMNRFLDRHGVLDAEYERAGAMDARFAAVLRPDGTPTPLAGSMLAVIDCSQAF